jgi:predicted DNA-binding protein
MSRIAVRIADDRQQELKSLARQSGLSKSDLIRIAINRLLENPDWLAVRVSHREAA